MIDFEHVVANWKSHSRQKTWVKSLYKSYSSPADKPQALVGKINSFVPNAPFL